MDDNRQISALHFNKAYKKREGLCESQDKFL